MTRDDVYRRQLDLDVAAIIRGMALAHGLQAAASSHSHINWARLITQH